MRIKIIHITPLLAAGAAAVAIVAAPTAMAATTTTGPAQQSCTNGVCPNSHTSLTPNTPLPGNVQINDSLGPVQYSPQYPYAEGDYYGGYGGYGRHGFGGGFGGFGGHGFGGGFGGHGGGHGR
jgi:hypothetical protein